jgi:hypothetical protein
MTMINLRVQLSQIANQFVTSVLVAMAGASLSDLADHSARADGQTPIHRGPGRPRGARSAPASRAAKRTAGGRRHRAPPEEVQRQKDVALAAAKSLKPGFNKGDVMKKSGSKVDLGRALSLLVAEGKLAKKGDRRRTTYSVK